jgi:hypothetical protein
MKTTLRDCDECCSGRRVVVGSAVPIIVDSVTQVVDTDTTVVVVVVVAFGVVVVVIVHSLFK